MKHDQCEEIRELFVDVLYREAEAVDERRMRAHLEECAECRSAFAELEAARGALDLVGDKPGQVELASVCLRSVGELTRAQRRWRVAAAGALAASLLVGFTAAFAFDVSWQPGAVLVAWKENAAPVDLPDAAIVVQPAAPDEAAPGEIRPSLAEVENYYPRLRDKVLAQGIDSLPVRKAGAADSREANGTYLELRQEMLKGV